jgi:hypothetical protein
VKTLESTLQYLVTKTVLIGTIVDFMVPAVTRVDESWTLRVYEFIHQCFEHYHMIHMVGIDSFQAHGTTTRISTWVTPKIFDLVVDADP